MNTFISSIYKLHPYTFSLIFSPNSKSSTRVVSALPLDNYAKKIRLDRLNFLKCDAEGYELEVLKGAKKTIKRHKPVIVSEIKDDKRFDFWEFIREYSYTEKAKLSNGDYVYVSKG